MPSEQAGLLMLAQAVADGASVDWDHAESSAQSPDERHVVAQLRRLAAVGAAARAQASHWGLLEIRAEVGSGTFGTVYRAWDARLEREVALKLLHDGHAERQVDSVVKEGRLLAQIRHPNVVTVHGADAHDGRVGIWMEFVTGRTLKDIVENAGPYGPHEAALIGRDLCRALAAVHQKELLHRDIKAQNVMREAGGRTVLMDFGASEMAADEAPSGVNLAGTPAYLAPEVLTGDSSTARSDLYSLGVLLYYLVSGGFPVTSRSLDDLRERHAQNKRTLLRDVRPDLPAAFLRVVDRATAANPADRPESAGAMEVLLENALDMRTGGVGTESAGESATMRPSLPVRRQFTWYRRAVYAVVAMALVGAAWAALASGLWNATKTTAGARNSVAILPFRNLTAGGEDEYFSDGVTEDLVAHLTSLGDLRVISGASALRYRDQAKSTREIGAELNVATVLTGSVRRSGDRVRIVSQLVDASTGEQLWSETFDRELDDIFALQSEVSRKIALALKGELSQRDVERLRPGRAHDFEAFNLYLKGRHQWTFRTEDGLNRSIQYFQDALARAPDYAPAYAGLADAYTQLGVYNFLPQADAFRRAGTFAEKAVALDDSLAEAHASLGYVRKNRFEWRAAEASFTRAIELKPGYAPAHHWYSVYLTQRGRFPEALTEIKAAISLDPLSIGANAQLGSVLVMARRYDDAIAQFARLLQMDAGFSFAYRGIAQANAYKGSYDRAREALDQAARRVPVASEDQVLQEDVGYVLAHSGHDARALEIARTLGARNQLTGEAVSVSVAAIYVGLRQKDRALEWLVRARDARDPAMGYLKVDPRWDGLRRDPRFQALLASLGFNE